MIRLIGRVMLIVVRVHSVVGYFSTKKYTKIVSNNLASVPLSKVCVSYM